MTRRIGIRIAPDDNVVTVVEHTGPGDDIQFITPDGSRRIASRQAIPMGHKVALKDIERGEKVVKYDQVIGTASAKIEEGEHVHVHNVRSAVQGAESEN